MLTLRPGRNATVTLICLLAWGFSSFFTGCASDRYTFGIGSDRGRVPTSQPANPVTFGGEHPTLDKIESIVQSPRIAIRRLAGKPEPTQETLAAERTEAIELSQEYLLANGLEDVSIDVRSYSPSTQWARIWQNENVAPFWKATGGTLSLLRYTLLPRRVLRSDHYDPYANTLSLNSDRPARSIYSAAEAKQYRKQRLTGTYAILQNVPVLPIAHHVSTTNDVLSYAEVTEQSQLQRELYPEAYSQIGRATVSEVLSVSPLAAGAPFYTAPMMQVAGRMVGRISGEAAASYQTEEAVDRDD